MSKKGVFGQKNKGCVLFKVLFFFVYRVNIGLFCSTPGVALARAVPRKVALEMLFTGNPISAEGELCVS